MRSSSALALLHQRRFAPLFWVQFLGAANDNVFKFAFTLLATYSAATWGGVDLRYAAFLIGALFIAPFLLFSATSGQLADRAEKSRLIRLLKNAEVAVMALAAVGLTVRSPLLVYVSIFLIGLQATVFGPVKYSYLPQHLEPSELTRGNGLIEMATFVAILLGTIVAGLLIEMFNATGAAVVALVIVLLALAGRVASQFIPHSAAADASLRIDWNPFSATAQNLKVAHSDRTVFNSILGISWLWFFGSIFLTSLAPFAREVLSGDEAVVTFLLAVFSIGIGAGSLLTDRLSGHKVEIGLVPLGSIGMTVFALDLYFASQSMMPTGMPLQSVPGFLAREGAWRIVADLALLSAFAGLYSVPLYALIQSRAQRTHVARIVAANNVLNALFIIVASIAAAALLSSGLTIPELFLVAGLMNAAVAIYIYLLVPEFLLRFVAWLVSHTLYRVRSIGTERLPQDGPVVLVCNHVSFVDAVVIMGESPRPIRFVMDYHIFRIPVLRTFFNQLKAIPIASAKTDPDTLQRAHQSIEQALEEGEMVCIFPEGRITDTGELAPFRPGVRRIVERNPVPVIPMALRGLWGSFFSRYGGEAFSLPIDARLRRGIRSKLEFIVGEPIPPAMATPELLMQRVQELRGTAK
ncbi:MAG TPA: MFS transporter [Burkholderiaceae bacterium]|nr:MFS transporter [Burkholderiaceae bacterium]